MSTMRIREPLILGDGTRLSVQASRGHYCTPREDDADAYTHVEVAADGPIPEFGQPEPNSGWLWGWVPASKVLTLLQERGGARSGEMPPLTAVVIARTT